jgi:hypothetical protein
MMVPGTLQARCPSWGWRTVSVAVLAVLFGGSIRIPSAIAAASNFTTSSFSVLLSQAKGVLPNAYGPVRVKVSTSLALSIQFNVVRGSGYVAGAVTATTNSNGRVKKLTKLNQACTISYAATGVVYRVRCTTAASNRALRKGFAHTDPVDIDATVSADADIAELDFDDFVGEEPRDGGTHVSRRLSDCSSCLAAVNATFATRVEALCGSTFARLAPATHPWAKAAASALCAMSSKLGKTLEVAYRTCRCSCDFNSECPQFQCSEGQCHQAHCTKSGSGTCSGVCSEGVCVAETFSVGQACPNADDDDCENRRCARITFPLGPYVCCSQDYIRNDAADRYEGEWYCTGTQKVGRQCFANALCESGVCSAGICIDGKLDVGQPCPDADNEDCANDRCARGSYPAGDYICCPTSTAGYIPGDGTYCAGTQEAGAACVTDWMCSAGTCSEQICLGSCDGDDSSTCDFGGGYCLDGVCRKDYECAHGYGDCPGDGSCGRAGYPSGDYTCCDGSDTPKVDVPPYIDGLFDWYCPRTQEFGEACVEDWMCETGPCVDGVCEGIGGEQECPLGVYARESYPSGDIVCCSGAAVSSNAINTFGKRYCAESFGVGSPCDANSMCSSGVCSGMVCREEKLSVGEPCDFVYKRGVSTGDCYWDGVCSDCRSGFCAKGSYPSGENVCCANRTVWSYTFEAFYCTGIQEIGSPCDSHAMCLSGACSVNRTTRCDAGAACARGACLENAATTSSTSAVGTTTNVHNRQDLPPWGRPTGGGVYPYLVVVDWTYFGVPVYDDENWKEVEPRVSCELMHLSATMTFCTRLTSIVLFWCR